MEEDDSNEEGRSFTRKEKCVGGISQAKKLGGHFVEGKILKEKP